jgi:hypothetical protein
LPLNKALPSCAEEFIKETTVRTTTKKPDFMKFGLRGIIVAVNAEKCGKIPDSGAKISYEHNKKPLEKKIF